MKKAYVYPDNSVTIDGQSEIWTSRDFRRLGIPPIHRARSLQESDDGARMKKRGMLIIVFPTVPITQPIKKREALCRK